ncbi:hypothetical protein FPZ43_05855 [Mucilaginibacter pallidiroseus]|uniref:Uncharacterized protein n=1 Tax=Mucilaginibacter pallidiroseus TaxID=2599295 RepID=A0A563UGI0_9SPHI|nr:hypothetical protein [Mucilaginibacter pallidiroseus]TWR30464.1 hypothetical protein FPZ43_05855 [Mucilaginibacter pallidiroseus]
MAVYHKLNKSDSIQIRQAKKSLFNRTKRKDKLHNGNLKFSVGKSSIERYKRSKIKFNNDIEVFCAVNNLHFWELKSSVIKFDNDFSISSNTDRVLKDLLILLRHAKTLNQNPRLTFNGHVSFGALYLIDTLCWEIGKRRQWVVSHPNLPDEEIEILKSLKSNVSSSVENEHEFLINERVRINRTTGSAGNQPYYARAKEITDMVQKAIGISLNDNNYQLPFDIAQAINSTVGEQFDNINLHATETDLGTLCGFYSKAKKEISILIFNFGPTIYQTLSLAELPQNVIQYIKTVKLNFGFSNKDDIRKQRQNHTIESIYTLLALQEGISSKLKEDESRGHGLIDFIEKVKLLNPRSQISVISGNTGIYLNNNSAMSESFLIDRERKQITLNQEGNLLSSPNLENLKHLKYQFPGVLIETIIPLNDVSLQTL